MQVIRISVAAGVASGTDKRTVTRIKYCDKYQCFLRCKKSSEVLSRWRSRDRMRRSWQNLPQLLVEPAERFVRQ